MAWCVLRAASAADVLHRRIAWPGPFASAFTPVGPKVICRILASWLAHRGLAGLRASDELVLTRKPAALVLGQHPVVQYG